VWFGTDRKPADPDAAEPYFSRNFDPQLRLVSCVVYVPKSHSFGEIGSSWLKRTFKTLVLRQEDDRLRIVDLESLDAAGFVASLRRELAHWTRRTALVFILADVLLIAAQDVRRRSGVDLHVVIEAEPVDVAKVARLAHAQDG
jgi:hypothetical protein